MANPQVLWTWDTSIAGLMIIGRRAALVFMAALVYYLTTSPSLALLCLTFSDDVHGNPLVNTSTFPDMKKMVDYGHSHGLRVGWYMNNCICREILPISDDERENHYANHVKAIIDFGYDGVKFDECGMFRNLTKWYQIINATGKEILIENWYKYE